MQSVIKDFVCASELNEPGKTHNRTRAFFELGVLLAVLEVILNVNVGLESVLILPKGL